MTALTPGAGRWHVRIDTGLSDSIADQVNERRARAHLLVGPGGIGKSTLLRAIGERLAERGHPLIPVTGDAALRGIPLGALAPILADTDPGTVETRLQRLFDAVAPARANHVFLIDDAHLLDAASGAVITRLIRVYGIRAVLAASSAQALDDGMAQLAEEGIIATTQLPRLDTAAASAAVERTLGGRVEPGDLRALLSRAGGNPLHLRELTIAVVRDGFTEPSAHGLRIRSGHLPARLRRSIAALYTGLDAHVCHYAELLAVAGSLPSPTEPAEVDAADALETAGLAEHHPGGGHVLAEPLHREILLGLLSSHERDERSIDAGERLSDSADPAHRYRAVVILARTTRPPSTADLEWAAAEAHARDDHELAVELTDLALRLAPGRENIVTAQSLLVRANALSVAGRSDEAEAAFDEVLSMTLDDATLAFGASRLGFHHALRRMNPGRGARRAEAFRARLRDPDAIAFLDTNIAKLSFMSGAPLPAADPDTDEAGPQELNVQLMRIHRSVFTGELAVARAAIERARALASAHSDLMPQAGAAADFGEFLLLVDEARGAEAHVHVRDVQSRRDDASKGLWAYGVALLALLRGEVEASYGAATDSAELLAWRDSIAAQGPAKALRATAAALTGRTTVARDILGTIDEETRRMNVPTDLQAAEAEAWLLAAAGDRSAAASTIAVAVRRGLDTSHVTFSALTAITAVRLDQANEVLALLHEAVAAAPGVPLVRLAADHAEALDARDPAALLASAKAYEAADFTAPAADAARQAAEIARSQGALSLARRAALAAARLDAPQPAARDAASALSAREYAVATAAAARLRNREIAEQLGLSVRTVENHLARAFRKLGVASRDELRAALE